MPKLEDIKQMSQAKYQVNVSWDYLEKWLKDVEANMNPDFQRGYVWNQKQKEQYVEWVLRGGKSGRDIYFNQKGWMSSFEGDMVIVDGKQRVDAVLGFLHNEVRAYGYYRKEYTDKLRLVGCDFLVHVADLKTKKEVLQWYIDMNTGGTQHTDEEIERVKALLKKEIE